MGEGIHIDDLTTPTFTPEVLEILAAMTGLAAGCRLDADALRAQAMHETGLDDFGPRDYEDRLDLLLRGFREVEGLTPAGLLGIHSQLLQMLKTRLLLFDLLRRRPDIHEIELEPPIIIAGLPRTGTTHLHNLMGADPAFRTLPYWESLEPIPLPGERGVEPDPRRARCHAAVWFINEAMPLFPLMHEMTTDHLHEEIQLLAVDFSTMFFETMAYLPRWEEYYRAHDQTPHYRFLVTMLKALQHERGGRRWLLKSPQHLEQLPVLAEVFPQATVVVTHRDPIDVVVSMTTMIAYTARMHVQPVDAAKLGRAWAQRLDVMLTACVRDRDALCADRSIDVRFDDFMADEVATVERIYALADQPFDDSAPGRSPPTWPGTSAGGSAASTTGRRTSASIPTTCAGGSSPTSTGSCRRAPDHDGASTRSARPPTGPPATGASGTARASRPGPAGTNRPRTRRGPA